MPEEESPKSSRRVLGGRVDPGPVPDPSAAIKPESYACPICGESMVSLVQLNRHIDDIHDDSSPTPADSRSPERGTPLSTPQRKHLKLDFYENSTGFGMSESDSSNAAIEPGKLTRAHWQRPSPNTATICLAPECRQVLNVKNGVVNCRKCGGLFCNEHTRFRARLANKDGGVAYEPAAGIYTRVCEDCYIQKPSIQLGTQVNCHDLTDQFRRQRQESVDQRQIERGMVHKRFIKLANYMSEAYLWHIRNRSNVVLYFSTLIGDHEYTPDKVLRAQREIVGEERWEKDADVTHCKICFVKFNVLIRKHHCRLCGSVVNDGSFSSDDPTRFCSVQVPLGILLRKLSGLNYSPAVKENWTTLSSVQPNAKFADLFSFRCCKTCKDLLIHTRNNESKSDLGELGRALDAYDNFLSVKSTLVSTLARYKLLIQTEDDSRNIQINKLRVRLRRNVKDLEILSNTFRQRFFVLDPQSGKYKPLLNSMLIINIHKASVQYLQESILELKRLNDEFAEKEGAKLTSQIGLPASGLTTATGSPALSVLLPPNVPAPRLTKKQIRELQEQLMVTNEQRFLIENTIQGLKRQRKFDEIAILEENKSELEAKISELTSELGEFGF